MKSLLLSFFLIVSISTHAQYSLVFVKADSSKIITIKQGDLARMGYNGYIGQPQEAEGNVSVITDSSVTLSPRKKFLQKKLASQTILIRDITGFRKFSGFRPAGEIIYAIAGVGITGGVAGIISNASTSTIAILLSTAATAAITTALKNIIFSHKIKNHLGKDWTIHLSPGKI